MLTLWTAVHLGKSPTSKTIRDLDSWQIGLIYETVMNYPEEWIRRSYFENKKSTGNFEDEDLLEMGYTPEQIAQIKGSK